MAITLACDGKDCADTLPLDTKPVGRLEPRFYCPDCKAVYDAADAEIERERRALVTAFNVKRSEIQSRAREKLGALPDE
mgnify:FL=1